MTLLCCLLFQTLLLSPAEAAFCQQWWRRVWPGFAWELLCTHNCSNRDIVSIEEHRRESSIIAWPALDMVPCPISHRLSQGSGGSGYAFQVEIFKDSVLPQSAQFCVVRVQVGDQSSQSEPLLIVCARMPPLLHIFTSLWAGRTLHIDNVLELLRRAYTSVMVEREIIISADLVDSQFYLSTIIQ